MNNSDNLHVIANSIKQAGLMIALGIVLSGAIMGYLSTESKADRITEFEACVTWLETKSEEIGFDLRMGTILSTCGNEDQ